MDPQAAKRFLEACTRAFAFLVRDHGFQPPTLEVDAAIHFAVVSFMGKHVAVECIFDETESWVEVKIARVVDGARPLDYAIDRSGRRVREDLYPLLIRRGVRGFGTRNDNLSELSLDEMFDARLSKDAELLRKHGKDIVGDSSEVLDA